MVYSTSYWGFSYRQCQKLHHFSAGYFYYFSRKKSLKCQHAIFLVTSDNLYESSVFLLRERCFQLTFKLVDFIKGSHH